MYLYTPEKPLMSDTQFAALTAVDQRAGAVDVERWRDCNVTTLRSMAGKLGKKFRHAPWVTLQTEGREIIGGRLTVTGINALDAERTRRTRQAEYERRLAVHTQPRPITRLADPFALVGAGADTIPF